MNKYNSPKSSQHLEQVKIYAELQRVQSICRSIDKKLYDNKIGCPRSMEYSYISY